MSPDILSELAPTGVLRAGINLGNFLLVNGKTPSGDPKGVAPDMAAEIAERLQVPVRYVQYKNPPTLIDAVDTNSWDVGLVGADPSRAEKIAFSPAYCEIEVTYLVPPGSPFHSISDVDRAGVRIAVAAGSAYSPWLDRNIKFATLMRSSNPDDAFNHFVADGLEALADLRPGLLKRTQKFPGSTILDGKLTAVQQSIGTARKNTAGAAFLNEFVEEAKASGLIARLIERHKAAGLSVAPAA